MEVMVKPNSCVLPWWLSGKGTTHNAGDVSLIPGSRRSPGEENGEPLQYSCLKSHEQRSLVGYSPWGCKGVGYNLAIKQQNNKFLGNLN